MAKRLTAAQRRLKTKLDELIDICKLRGINSRALRQIVHDCWTHDTLVDSPLYVMRWRHADETSAAGVAAQLSYLLEVWGEKRLRNALNNIGGVLDAIVMVSSSSPKELEDDVGRKNINDDGYVIG